MDYLQTHHSNDHEKMQMVALKFGMFYELAKTKQDQAKRDLKRIKPKHLGKYTDGLHICNLYMPYIYTCLLL